MLNKGEHVQHTQRPSCTLSIMPLRVTYNSKLKGVEKDRGQCNSVEQNVKSSDFLK